MTKETKPNRQEYSTWFPAISSEGIAKKVRLTFVLEEGDRSIEVVTPVASNSLEGILEILNFHFHACGGFLGNLLEKNLGVHKISIYFSEMISDQSCLLAIMVMLYNLALLRKPIDMERFAFTGLVGIDGNVLAVENIEEKISLFENEPNMILICPAENKINEKTIGKANVVLVKSALEALGHLTELTLHPL